MAYCDSCGNFDDSHLLECGIESKEYEQTGIEFESMEVFGGSGLDGSYAGRLIHIETLEYQLIWRPRS